jgi:hypothetical protein
MLKHQTTAAYFFNVAYRTGITVNGRKISFSHLKTLKNKLIIFTLEINHIKDICALQCILEYPIVYHVRGNDQ